MRPVSDAFLRTLKGAHQMVAQAIVCSTFQTTTSPTGTTIPILDGGDVQIDGSADIRSTLDMTTVGDWPRFATDLLAPVGNEVYVRRGIAFSDGLIEWVGLGYFRIQSPEQDIAPDGPIRLAARDRMAGIIDARLLAPVQYPAGTTLGAIVADLVTEVYPSATITWDDSSTNTIARAAIADEDRYGFLNDLITAAGKIWYWDYAGQLVVKTLPDPTSSVFEVSAGAGGVLVNMSRHLTRDGVYNAVVATGEGTDTTTPPRGVAFDDNPASPTYFNGRFGPVPRFYNSSFLTTDDQARAAAASILSRQLGLPYSVDLTAAPNPALEPYDPITVRFPLTGLTETHVLEKLTIPLVADQAMTASTREQSVVLIGHA